jgi:DNA-binding response OmpR family regulator
MPKVMIAEDDLLIADALEEVLLDSGYDVCGIARTVEKAIELGERHKPDLAILDIRLAEGGLGTDIPARLKNQGRMGVLYASGHVPPTGLTSIDGDALLIKPYRPEDVVRALKIVESIVIADRELRHSPEGFSVLGSATDKAAVFTGAELAQQISRLRRQQAELARFGAFGLSEHDLNNLLVQAARISAECLGFPYCTVYQYRSEENDLLAKAGFGWNEGVIGRVTSRVNTKSPHGRAFISLEPVVCDALGKDETFERLSHYTDYGIVSTLDVIIWNDCQSSRRPYGVLELDSPGTNSNYGAFDIDFLTGIANILALAIDRARREAALNDAGDFMRDMDEDRTNFFGVKHGRLGEKNQLLKRLMDRVSGAAALQSDHG